MKINLKVVLDPAYNVPEHEPPLRSDLPKVHAAYTKVFQRMLFTCQAKNNYPIDVLSEKLDALI